MEYDSVKEEMLSRIDTALKYAKSVDKNAECEIYLLYINSCNVRIQDGVVTADDGIKAGTAVRVAKGKKVSFAPSSGIELDSIKKSIQEATAIVQKLSVEDPRFDSFCPPSGAGKEGVFCSDILDVDSAYLIKAADNMISEAKSVDKRIKSVTASCSAGWTGFAVGNSTGLQQASRIAVNSCNVYCQARVGEERRQAGEYDISRERIFQHENLPTEAANKALSFLGAKKLDKTEVMPTIWNNEASASYILAGLGQAVRGNNVVEGLSPLADKIGDEIANPILSIVDDGQDATSIQTHAIDAEGHAKQKIPILEKGVLKNYLFDHYYAKIFGAESTGSSSRGGAFSSTLPYEDTATVGLSTFNVKSGNKSEEELLEEVDQGIYIYDSPMGIYHTSVETGEFSVVCPQVYLIERGEKTPIQPVSVAGKFYEGLENLRAIAKNIKKTPYAVNTPTIAFDGFSVVG